MRRARTVFAGLFGVLAVATVLFAGTASASAQDAPDDHTHGHHRVSFESEGLELDVHAGESWESLHHICTTPCGHVLHDGRYHLAFSNGSSRDPVHFEAIDVTRAITLRVEWIDRRDLRLAGDVVLIVGLTLGALIAGTAFGGYQDGDDGLLALGVSGLSLVGTSMIVGIPLSVMDDSVQRAR